MVPAVVARHEAKYFVVGGQHNPIQLAVDRVARRGEATWHALRDAARRSMVNGIDETGWNVAAQLRWLWVTVSEHVTNRSRERSSSQAAIFARNNEIDVSWAIPRSLTSPVFDLYLDSGLAFALLDVYASIGSQEISLGRSLSGGHLRRLFGDFAGVKDEFERIGILIFLHQLEVHEPLGIGHCRAVVEPIPGRFKQ